jgi:hypothetical protein
VKSTEKLDAVLSYFVVKEPPRAHFDEIIKSLSEKIPVVDLFPIIDKLIKDLYIQKYIDQLEQAQRFFKEGEMPANYTVEYYIITFEGKLFFELGGYTEDEKRERIKLNKESEKLELDIKLKKWQVNIFWWLFAMSIISFLYTIIEVLSKFI